MHPTDKAARIAGAVYLSMAFTAPFSLIYIPAHTHRARGRHRDRQQHPGSRDAFPCSASSLT